VSPRSQSARLGQPVLTTAGADAVGKLALLVTTLFVAHALSPLLFGEYIGLAATLAVAAALWDLGLTTLVTREVGAGRIGVAAGIRQVLLLRLRTILVWAAAFLIGATILAKGGAVSPLAIGGFAAASVVFGVHSIVLAVLRASLKFGMAGAAMASGRCVTAVGVVLAMTVGGSHSLATVGFLTLLGEATTLALARFFITRVALPVPCDESRLSIRAAIPFAANSAFSMVYNRLDVILVPALAGVSQLALYAPASRIQDALYFLPSALGTVALPVIAARHHRTDSPLEAGLVTRRLLAAGLLVAIPVTAAVFIFIRPILATVLGLAYQGAETPTRILVWFLPLAVVQAPLFAALIALGRERSVTKIIAATFGTALLLHLTLDPVWGAVGGAIASLARDLVAAPLALVVAARAGILSARRTNLQPVGEI
jgi:O-antigen/teichoic acid export membrane protein